MTSRTTPTISRRVASSPLRRYRPIGDSFPKSSLAREALMMTTGGVPSRSPDVKSRPARSGMPTVEKYSGEMAFRYVRCAGSTFPVLPSAANVDHHDPCSLLIGALKDKLAD